MKNDQRQEAVRLRIEERMSIGAIANELDVSKASVSTWVRSHPLTEAERFALRYPRGTSRMRDLARKDRGTESQWHRMCGGKASLSRDQKCRIAEAAVLFRLSVFGYLAYASVFDGDKTDWLVSIQETGRVVKVQVRWARTGRSGLPYCSLRCSDGRKKTRRYKSAELDFLVAYDLFTDTAYVFSASEISHLNSVVSIRPECAERWDKLRLIE